MSNVELSLLVLRCGDLEAVRAFYGALGLEFVSEQHGAGPQHYACDLGGMVLELYPGEAATATPWPPSSSKCSGATMLGVRVADLDATLEALRALGVATPQPKSSKWGRRVVVFDCDGRAVDVSEAN